MYVVTEADAAAIREIYERDGELPAAAELRRRFPGITDNAIAKITRGGSPAGHRRQSSQWCAYPKGKSRRRNGGQYPTPGGCGAHRRPGGRYQMATHVVAGRNRSKLARCFQQIRCWRMMEEAARSRGGTSDVILDNGFNHSVCDMD